MATDERTMGSAINRTMALQVAAVEIGCSPKHVVVGIVPEQYSHPVSKSIIQKNIEDGTI